MLLLNTVSVQEELVTTSKETLAAVYTIVEDLVFF